MNKASADVISFQVGAMSIMVEVEAMQIANIIRVRNGDAPAYGEKEFTEKSLELAGLAASIAAHAEYCQ